MTDPKGRPPLEPARPDVAEGEGRPSYAPRIPWKWIVIVLVGVGGTFASYYVRQDQRHEALRTQMLTLHEEELGEIAERYLGFRRELTELVMEAAEEGAEETYVDPRLNIAGLRSGEGLYLRISADWADSADRVEGAAMAMESDAITRCLGIAPMSARGLWERGHFLTPEYVDTIREEDEVMQLRVLDDQLGRHAQVDTPVIASMMQADWFLLVLERGENRRDHPVDVFLWDLDRDQLLLRSRIQGRGLLVPVRIRFEGVDNPRYEGQPQVRSGGATDCSIASQILALTGREGVEFESGDALADPPPSSDPSAPEAPAEPSDPAEPSADSPEPSADSPEPPDDSPEP
ncbi:MAG: hypothetical protein VYE22_04640 [Myxococcota bacterium]|nr:hypothetical protein [Myxococcota bacterium]